MAVDPAITMEIQDINSEIAQLEEQGAIGKSVNSNTIHRSPRWISIRQIIIFIIGIVIMVLLVNKSLTLFSGNAFTAQIISPRNNEKIPIRFAEQGSALINVSGIASGLHQNPDLKIYIIYRSLTPRENIWWIAPTTITVPSQGAWQATVWSGDAGHQRIVGDKIELYTLMTRVQIPADKQAITSADELSPVYTSEPITIIIGDILPP